MIELLADHVLQRLLVRVACVCAACLKDEEIPDTPCPHESLGASGGVFVTLTRRGALAGCIGYAQSPLSLWETATHAARGAALEDPRFDRLPAQALDEVDVELSVLTSTFPIAPEEVEVGRHGLLLDCHGQRGLLLPQVAIEHRLDREAFLDALARKAGLAPQAWAQPDCRLEAFEAQVKGGPLLGLCGEEPQDG